MPRRRESKESKHMQSAETDGELDEIELELDTSTDSDLEALVTHVMKDLYGPESSDKIKCYLISFHE